DQPRDGHGVEELADGPFRVDVQLDGDAARVAVGSRGMELWCSPGESTGPSVAPIPYSSTSLLLGQGQPSLPYTGNWMRSRARD
ncbi:MAG: hypothetical protein ACJ8F7_15040, partial [Gemmataceae bacterium]